MPASPASSLRQPPDSHPRYEPSRAATHHGRKEGARGGNPVSPALLDAVAQPLSLGQRLELLQRVVLDLADPFARDAEGLADLLERARLHAVEPEAQLDHAPLALG